MVNISKQDNAIIFAFTDSQYYLFGTGSIEVPMNALSLVIDESDMITFRKASSNDIFVSVPLDETNFSTKADVVDFYKENMVGSSGSADAFTGVSYDSTNQEIVFTNKDDEEVATLDASAFVIDGMVDDVKVENGYLVIDFNTASGKQDIYIPLTSFFDASQYYTKIEVDNTFLTKAVFDVKEEVISDALNQLDEDKVDTSDLATVATSGSYNDLTNKPTIPAAQVQANWNESDSSSMAYIQNKPTIPDTSNFVTVSQYNPKEQAIAEALTELNDNKVDASDLATVATSGSYNDLSNKPVIPDVSNYLTKSEFDVKEEVISRALNALNSEIGDINTILQSI